MYKQAILLLAALCAQSAVTGQQKAARKGILGWLHTENDSAYIEDHTRDITFRLYGSRKYTYYDIVDTRPKNEILYRPNNDILLGFGANYKFIGINLGFNFPFVNRDNERYGRTRYLDLQSHIYLRKLVIDFYAQRYRGYYISNPDGLINDHQLGGPFPKRPDLYNLDLGVSVQYIFNDKRFSYRAAYLQNEYQKKSAGSFMVGGEVFGIKIKGDSSLIPADVSRDFFDFQRYSRTSIFSLAATAGYAHTFVYKQRFFLTLSMVGGLGLNTTQLYLDNGAVLKDAGWQLNNTIRASVGYNSHRYFAGIHYVNIVTRSQAPVPHTYQTFGTGNFRFSLVRRFTLKRQLF